MKFLKLSIALVVMLSACLMQEDIASGDSIIQQTNIGGDVKTSSTALFGLQENDGVVQSSKLLLPDASSNLYLSKLGDINSVVWTRFWMADSTIQSGEVASSLLDKSLDTLNPRLHLYYDKSYYENSLAPSFDPTAKPKVSVRLHYFVDSYNNNAENYESEIKERYEKSILNDSLLNHRIENWTVKTMDLTMEYIDERDTTITKDSTQEISGTDTTYVLTYDTVVVETPKYSIPLKSLEIWKDLLLAEGQEGIYQFLNIGVEILDDATLPIKYVGGGELSTRPVLAMYWSSDSTIIDSIVTVGDKADTVSHEAYANKSVKKAAILARSKVASIDRSNNIKMYTGIGDTLVIAVPRQTILDAMGLDGTKNFEDTKMLLWAKLNIPIPAGSYTSQWNLGTRFVPISYIPSVENTQSLFITEAQFEDVSDSEFRPTDVLWPNPSDDTLSLYINEIARRAVNYNAEKIAAADPDMDLDTLKIKIRMSNSLTDSAITTARDVDSQLLYTSFNQVDLGSKSSLQMNIDLGWVDLRGAQ